MIRKATLSDGEFLARIYNYYVLHTAITFETLAQSAESMADRIALADKDVYPFWVYVADGMVVGYCSLARWNPKQAYETTAEVSIYIDIQHTGRGIGRMLMQHMISVLDRDRFHSLIGCITVPNEKSVALHSKFGFKRVSHINQVGRKFDHWHDVEHWQLILSIDVVGHGGEYSCPCGANDYCRCH